MYIRITVSGGKNICQFTVTNEYNSEGLRISKDVKTKGIDTTTKTNYTYEYAKEKISIQSAIKLALAFFYSDNIIWIPIALEEILRVSGAVGLSQNGGLFSAKKLGYNYGATSDDLLLFGVEIRDEKVYVHIYPLEVKIGYKNADEITKATEQIKQTKKIFDTGELCIHL